MKTTSSKKLDATPAADPKSVRTTALAHLRAGVEPLWDPVQPTALPRYTPLRRQPSAWSREATGNKLALVAADAQIGFRQLHGKLHPFHDVDAMQVFVQVAEAEQPETVVLCGDLMDLPGQSRFTQEASFAGTTQAALQAATEWLARLRAAVPRARIVVIEGNHEQRLHTMIERNALSAFGLKRADLPGETADVWPVLSLPSLLRLDALNIEYADAYPAATVWLNDSTRAIHGTKSNSRGSTTASYVAENPQLNTVAGHSHRQEITWHRTVGERNQALLRFSLNPGVLCRVDGAVPGQGSAVGLDGTPAIVHPDWQQGFGLIRYNEKETWPELFPIINGQAVVSGRRYTAAPVEGMLNVAA